MSSPYASRGRGRGHSDNRGGWSSDRSSGRRSSDGNSGGRSSDGNSGGRNYDRNNGYRGEPGPRGNSRGRGQGYNRGGHRESRENRNMIDHNLISNQNVQWDYNKSKVGLVKPEFVKRKEYLSDKFGRKIKLMTNHFSFEFSADVNIYHYNFSWLYHSTDQRKKEPEEKKLNRSECYQLFDAVLKQHSKYFKRPAVGYDGCANVYLPYVLQQDLKDLPVTGVELEGRSLDFSVTFELVKIISLAPLKEYYAGSETDDVKRNSVQEAIQALHIILKFPARYNMIALGRLAMFPVDGDRHYLSDWIKLALGHRKSLRCSEIGLTLVVDRASAAFLKSGDALDFMRSILNFRGRDFSSFIPSPEQIEVLKRAFTHVKVSTVHIGFAKKYAVHSIAENAAMIDRFMINKNGIDKEITVADYFADKYQYQLLYPNLPCIITTNRSRIPIEACKIVPNQSLQSIKSTLDAKEKAEMIKLTATSPDERFTCLLQAHQQIYRMNEQNEALKDFKFKIHGKPIGLEGIVLNAPKLLYRGEELTPRDGAWNLKGKSFFREQAFQKFGVLNFCVDHEEGKTFCDKFVQQAFQKRMAPTSNLSPVILAMKEYKKFEKHHLENYITDALKKLKSGSCAFALCFFPDDNYNKLIYNLTKRIGDTIVYLPTQGVTVASVKACSVQTIDNILAKVNKKLGGVNVILKQNMKPALLRDKIMIIGADVTHPGEADELDSSVAASVSTYDFDHATGFPSVRVQTKKDGKEGKKIVEVIKDFKSMIQDHLSNYLKKNSERLPEVILYLRDGVSDGQYSQILNEEVRHLRDPYGNGRYKPKVTAVIISKRILTRARPLDPRDGVGNNLNVPPGTTIDRIITHPSDFDYFQYGHKGIKGTSRPCHYYMIHDDNNLTINEMAKISYYLCHMFERATSSTSAPAPVMYAHNLAFKARKWICSTNSKVDLRRYKGEERFKEEEKIAKNLNSIFSKINAEYASTGMFYI